MTNYAQIHSETPHDILRRGHWCHDGVNCECFVELDDVSYEIKLVDIDSYFQSNNNVGQQSPEICCSVLDCSQELFILVPGGDGSS